MVRIDKYFWNLETLLGQLCYSDYVFVRTHFTNTDEITHPFANVKDFNIEAWKRISKIISHL